MRVALTDDPTTFVRGDWTEIVRTDPDGTFFHTPAYLKLWWEEFGTGELVVALASEGTDVVGACCFEVIDRTIRFLGGFDVTDYLGPVAVPGLREEVANELLRTVAEQLAWERADLRGIPAASPWCGSLIEAAESFGLGVGTERDDVAPFLSLPGSFDLYLGGLPPKLRHEIRRKERRLRAEAGAYRVTLSTPETLRADMDWFLDLHRASPGPKGRFMRAGMELFFRRLAEAFLPAHLFHLASMEIDGQKVAGAVGFGFGRTFSLYNSAFDRRVAELAPGMVLVAEMIRLAIGSGRSGFDLLKGDLAYKYRFGAIPREIRAIRLAR